MASPRIVTLAFAGEGTVTEKNVFSLLDDFLGVEDDRLPDHVDLRLLLPVSDTHLTEAIDRVLAWTEARDLGYDVVLDEEADKKKRSIKAALGYANDVLDVQDVNKEIIDQLRRDREAEEDGEVYLVLAWGESGDDNSEWLLEKATDKGIPALDLTYGLDDLALKEDEPEPEPEPEPERPRRQRGRSRNGGHDADPDDRHEQSTTEEQEPPRRRRSRAKPLDEEEKPLPDEDEPKAEEPPARRRRSRAKPAEEPADEAQDTHEVKVAQMKAEAEAAVKAAREKVDAENAAKSEGRMTASKPDLSRLERRFHFHRANEVTVPKHERLRGLTMELALVYEDLIPAEADHERHLAITQLEAALMWANAGVARYEGGENPDTAQTAADDAQATAEQPRRGRGRPRNDGQPTQPRSPEDRAVVEIWDEDEEQWVRKGRGRVPKGAKTRRVDPKTGDVVSEDE